MNKIITSLTLAIFIAILASGCATPTFKTTRLFPGPDVAVTRSVKLFNIGEPVPGNYEILGVVTAIYPSLVNDVMLKKLFNDKAAAMGADALVGFYSKPPYWASALAVRLLQEGQRTKSHSGGCIMAIPQIIIYDAVDTKGRAEKINEDVLHYVQFYSAQKGYYVITIDEPTPDPFEAGFKAMDEAGLDKYGGAQADLILVTQLIESDSSTIIVSSTHSISIENAIYSKSQKKMTWQNAAIADAKTGWMENIAAPSLKMYKALEAAVQKSLMKLPDISTK